MLKYDVRTGVRKIKTRTALAISALGLTGAGIFGSILIFGSAHAAGTTWQLNAPSTLTFMCGGSPYVHTLNTVSEDLSTGNFTGTGSYNLDTSYTWNATGNITNININISILYTGTGAGSVYNLAGTIAPDGSISGTSDSNCQTFSMPAGTAQQTNQVIVTPYHPQGWSTSDTRPGGAANIIADTSAPGDPHQGALRLTTDATTTSKAQYMHEANVPLSNISNLNYYTKQNSASFADGAPSYQLVLCLGGVSGATCNGFTTLVYEPYNNGFHITPSAWQFWNAMAGSWWSSRTVTDGSCAVVNGAGGPPFYTVTGLAANCPNAVAVGFGVNIGSNNPSYDTEADLVNFNGTVYNFEPYAVATDKDACKKDGWMNLSRADGSSFKNQGDCVSYTNNGK